MDICHILSFVQKVVHMGHITVEQRYTISAMLDGGYSQSEISRVINKDKSVVSREISRNRDQRNGEYRADLAERKARTRQKEKVRPVFFTAEIESKVEELIREDYSPEQVVGFMKKKGLPVVSHERIYQHIWQDKKEGGSLYTHLRRHGRRYRKRGNKKDTRGLIKNRIGIEKRPKIVDRRVRIGDLEVDTIIGKNHKGAIVTINDRVSGVLKMKKVERRTKEAVGTAVIEMLKAWMWFIKTITGDNGKEFSDHEKIAEYLNIKFYFARPYHSWERGSNENLNGLIRQYIPKKSDFSTIDDEFIKSIEIKLNDRPRKRLDFETPKNKMNQLLKKLNKGKVAFES